MKFLPLIHSRAARGAALLFSLGPLAALPVRADAVFSWNEAMLHVAAATAGTQPLHLEARSCAMAHLAMTDALERLGALEPDAELPARRAAVLTAAHAVLVAQFPAGRTLFDALAERQLAGLPAGAGRDRGVAAGRAAAQRVLEQRAHDGWEQVGSAASAADRAGAAGRAAQQGESAPSPWRDVRMFALSSAEQFAVAEIRTVRASGEIHVDPTLLDARLFDGVDRAAALAARDGFWAQSPVVAWNRIARQACVQRATDLRDQARLLAALNVALADAIVSARHARHVVGSWRTVPTEIWRPVEAGSALSGDVLARIDDGERFEHVRLEHGRMLIPPTGDYPAVTATVAGAAQAVLTAYFQGDTTGFNLPGKTSARTFPGFAAAAREQAFVASLDGVHSRESCVAGYRLGAEIGRFAGRRPAFAQR